MTNAGLPDLLNALDRENLHITIETSGIKFVPDLPCDLMSISPKLANSTPAEPDLATAHEKMRFDLPSLQQLIDNYQYQLKFVVDGPDDIGQVEECLTNLENVNRGKVFLMPQAARLDEYLAKSKMTAELCKQTGFRFSPRLQVNLWNGQKGM